MIEFERFELKNGLKVLVHQDKSTPIAALNILYDVGASDENPEQTGFAHLFEHLMFGGSKNIRFSRSAPCILLQQCRSHTGTIPHLSLSGHDSRGISEQSTPTHNPRRAAGETGGAGTAAAPQPGAIPRRAGGECGGPVADRTGSERAGRGVGCAHQ